MLDQPNIDCMVTINTQGQFLIAEADQNHGRSLFQGYGIAWDDA
jgi:hypothetical protein